MQTAHRFGDSLPRRIVLVRALRGLGDLLCMVPFLRGLRQALPHAEVVLLGMPEAQSFVERFAGYLDGMIDFPGYPGIVERQPIVQDLPAFFAGVHRRALDLAIQVHGSGIVSNPFTVLLGARRNAGFYLPGQYCPDPELFLAHPASEHEIRRLLRLGEFLGFPFAGEHLEFPITPADEADLARVSETQSLTPSSYICVHPGANEAHRQWDPQHFSQVADRLAGVGYRIVLTGSPGEASLVGRVAASMRHPAINLAGKTSLGALAALFSRARLVICNDTGVSHLAAALRTPSVVTFVASDPDRWAPLDTQLHRAVGRPLMLACNHAGDLLEERCLREGCAFIGPAVGGAQVVIPTAELVVEQALDLLGLGVEVGHAA